MTAWLVDIASGRRVGMTSEIGASGCVRASCRSAPHPLGGDRFEAWSSASAPVLFMRRRRHDDSMVHGLTALALTVGGLLSDIRQDPEDAPS